MPTDHLDLISPRLNRRTVLLGGVGLLALPAWQLAAAAVPPAPDVWPNALQVPGGVARLSLGPAAARPVAQAGEVPLLVLGDVIEWTALVGIPLSAAPGRASITVKTTEDSGPRQVGYSVAPKRYTEQRLKVAPGTVDLSSDNQARYERERAHQATVMATFSEPLPQASRSARPFPSCRSQAAQAPRGPHVPKSWTPPSTGGKVRRARKPRQWRLSSPAPGSGRPRSPAGRPGRTVPTP